MKVLYPGFRIGKLTLIKKIEKSWECQCDCGKKTIKKLTSLYTAKCRKSISCGCSIYQYNIGKNSYKWKGHEEISGRFWERIKANANKRKIKFNILIEDAWNKFILQDRKCALSGELLAFQKQSYDYKNQTASLDRINSLLEYNLDNTHWIHKIINDMKWNLNMKEFIEYCKLITFPIKNKKICNSCSVIKKHKNWNGFGNISGDYWYRIKTNAKKRNILLDIDIKTIWNLFIEQEGYCSITGLPIYLTGKNFTASLDRINNSLGYTKENIHWIHKDINQKIKKELSIEDVIFWAKKITTYQGVKK